MHPSGEVSDFPSAAAACVRRNTSLILLGLLRRVCLRTEAAFRNGTPKRVPLGVWNTHLNAFNMLRLTVSQVDLPWANAKCNFVVFEHELSPVSDLPLIALDTEYATRRRNMQRTGELSHAEEKGRVEFKGKTVTVRTPSGPGLIHNSNAVPDHSCCFLHSKDFLPSFHGNFRNL